MSITYPEWPVLTHYDQAHLRRIALPLGGIGTGTVSLGGRGDLRDWEVVNRPAKGFAPKHTFFALYARPAEGEAVTRALEGRIDPADYEGKDYEGPASSGRRDRDSGSGRGRDRRRSGRGSRPQRDRR